MARTASEPFHVGVTPDLIIDTALQLTRASNLFGWSIRDLARELGVTPSVIYHHIGGKDLIARHLCERVVATVAMPSAALSWQDWFRELLTASIYPATVAHPGVAKWLLMHGVPFPSATGILEIGIRKLQDAGAGDQSIVAYSAILNSAMLTVSMGDERLLHEDDGPRDHAAMMEEFTRAFTDGPGATRMGGELIAEFAKGGDTAARMRERYFRYVVDVTIAGVGALMDAPGGSTPD